MLCAAATLLLVPARARAGAWTLGAGHLYAKITYGASSANDQFGFDGGIKPVVEGLTDYPFADRSFYLYAEYGWNDALTLTAMLPYKRVFVHDNLYRYSTVGLADVALGARYRVYAEGNWVGSVSGQLSVPSGYHRDNRPPLGSGQMDAAVALNVGRSFWPLPAYATGTVGFRYRSSVYTSRVSPDATTNPFFQDHVNYSNELFGTVECGWTFFNHLLVHAVANALSSLRGTGTAFTISSVPSTQRFVKLGGGAAVGFMDHYELSADAFVTPAGMNTTKSIDVFFGAGVSW